MKKELLRSEEVMELAFFIAQLNEGYFKERMKQFVSVLQDENTSFLLDNAKKDGHIDDKTISMLKETYNAHEHDVAEIFKLFYDKPLETQIGKDTKKVEVNLITPNGSAVWRMKAWIEEHFDMTVIDPETLLEKMKNESPEEYARIKGELDQRFHKPN